MLTVLLIWGLVMVGLAFGVRRLHRWAASTVASRKRDHADASHPLARRSRRPASTDTTAPAGIPPGWTYEEYVADGLRCLQIMLVQEARRTQP